MKIRLCHKWMCVSSNYRWRLSSWTVRTTSRVTGHNIKACYFVPTSGKFVISIEPGRRTTLCNFSFRFEWVCDYTCNTFTMYYIGWDAAKKHCEGDGVKLTSLRNEWSQTYVELLALNLNAPLWIGLNTECRYRAESLLNSKKLNHTTNKFHGNRSNTVV